MKLRLAHLLAILAMLLFIPSGAIAQVSMLSKPPINTDKPHQKKQSKTKKSPLKTSETKAMPSWVKATSDSLEKSESDNKRTIVKQIAQHMVYIQGGSMAMPCSSGKTSIQVKSFYMSSIEVTQEQWEAIMGENPSYFVDSNQPVENVSWSECNEFIKRLNKLTGKKYRLPTIDEWTYAARGGQKSRDYEYAGSHYLAEVAWYSDNSNGYPHQVGKLKSNELGLSDLCGNVAEWCSDSAGQSHAFVGGSFADEAKECETTKSMSAQKFFDEASATIGFRLILTK